MTQGFVTLGIDTDADQIRYSYALALSIKQCDPTAEVCLIVDKDKSDLVPSKYFNAFDYITELPFGNTGYNDGFHASNIWQLQHCTPFDETIYVDSDSIFKNVDVELLWDQFKNYGFAMSSFARSYRNIPVYKNSIFDIEITYNLPQLYSNLIYFDRGSNVSIEWFKMADPVFQNWRDVYRNIFKEKKPETFNKNILCNVVTHLLDVENEVKLKINNLYDLDNKSQSYWSNDVPNNWTEMLNYWYTQKQHLIIENSSISGGIIHYRDRKFLTEEILNVIKANSSVSS
jgi:hypothetical protein